ncbi:MAG: DUF1330 domain-containing protein [Burkholderiaceae bacterium]
MPAYLIGDVEVLDGKAYEEYRQKVPAVIAAYGGRYLARGGATEVLEGHFNPKRCIILEFPSLEQFKTWWNSPEYQPLKALRERVARSNLVVTEGL